MRLIREASRELKVRVALAPNPSHLEAVGPVVLGSVRALQQQLGDCTGAKILPLLLHGDASFSGLGIVAECMQLANTAGGWGLHAFTQQLMLCCIVWQAIVCGCVI